MRHRLRLFGGTADGDNDLNTAISKLWIYDTIARFCVTEGPGTADTVEFRFIANGNI